MEKKIILFGAGDYGRRALRHYGRERVYCFADNNAVLAGKLVEGVPVISFDRLKEIYQDYQVVLAVGKQPLFVMAAQLEDAGIGDYEIFLKIVAEELDQTIPDVPPLRTVEQPRPPVEDKRVLMAAYWFPPLGGSGVFRSTKFAKYLPCFGWSPTVLSADRAPFGWNYMDPSLLQEIPQDIPVVRIPDLFHSLRDPRLFHAKTIFDRRDELLSFLQEILQYDEEANQIFSSLVQTRTGAAELLSFPCGALSWAYDVVQYIEENVDLSQFKAIYTTSSPYSAHLIGFWLKKKHGIPWVADYRDPWTKSPLEHLDFSRPRDRLFARLESILLHGVDRNIIVVEESVQEYVEDFQLPEEKVTAITNGYDETDFDGLDMSWKHHDRFIINYCGLLVGSIEAVLASLQQLSHEGKIDLEKIQLRIVGGPGHYNPSLWTPKYGLLSIMLQTGYLPHEKALETNVNADVLLHLVGDGRLYKHTIGSKLYDYLRSGRPILALAPPDGVVGRVLRKTGHGEAFTSEQIPEIKAMLLREYRRWQSGEPREPLCAPEIKQYERKYLTGKLAQVFDSVMAKP